MRAGFFLAFDPFGPRSAIQLPGSRGYYLWRLRGAEVINPLKEGAQRAQHMTEQHETVLATGLQRAQVLEAIRQAFRIRLGPVVDGSVLTNGTAGSSDTESLHLQWVNIGDGEVIALQGLDKAHGHLWEFCAAELPHDRVAITRRTIHRGTSVAVQMPACLLDALWDGVLGQAKAWDAHNTPKAPTFMTVAAAALATGGLTAINDQSQALADARDEVEYYRDLSRSQARLLKEQKSLAGGFNVVSADQDEVPAAGPSSQVDTTSLKNLDQWATLNSDRIVVLQRAISAAKRSPYENPPLVYECLELLAHEYRLTKLGQIDRNVFRERCIAMGLDFGGSVDASRAGAAGDEYFVRWGGRRLWLDQHIGKSTARDPRFILRIYYTWSEEDGKVIVGWLPSHLSNSKT